jgi:hypothetical protein
MSNVIGFTSSKVDAKIMHGGKGINDNYTNLTHIIGLFSNVKIYPGEILTSFQGEIRKPSNIGAAWAISLSKMEYPIDCYDNRNLYIERRNDTRFKCSHGYGLFSNSSTSPNCSRVDFYVNDLIRVRNKGKRIQEDLINNELNQLLSKIPVLRAIKIIYEGDEIVWNYRVR